MRKNRKVLLLIIVLFMLLEKNIFAFEQLSEESYKGILTVKYNVKESEEDEFLNFIQNRNGKEDIKYELINFHKTNNENNTKQVTKTISKNNLESNERSMIRQSVPEILNYSEDGYIGNLKIASIEVDTVNNGKYEEIEKLDIPFDNAKINDLDNIDKEITQNGKKYYLINVEWQNDEIREVDGNIIPISYKGIKHYQTVVEKENAETYNAIIHYIGEVELEDKMYQYEVTYSENRIEPTINEESIIEPEIEKIENKKNYAVPVIIISEIGIVLITVLIISKKKNSRR